MDDPVDILVVGAGAAGVAAAVTAARLGRTTLLLDQHAAAGGTGGFSGLTTLCGLYDEQGALINGGFAAEFAEAVGETAPMPMVGEDNKVTRADVVGHLRITLPPDTEAERDTLVLVPRS